MYNSWFNKGHKKLQTDTAREEYSQKLIPSFPVLCSLLPWFTDPIRCFDLSSMPPFLKSRKYFHAAFSHFKE